MCASRRRPSSTWRPHRIAEFRDAGFDHVIVDLRALDFVDSTGLRLLLELNSAAQPTRTGWS
ncbi:STAS domain-containing protein [Candidatus Solirubrobacter pratensis]|uniref:STAS domain-containing protein n=1 Tax=Candidatus Solirubrobacter pratensis TaxID=1298857 RepID=UPI00041BDCCC|nr:STAS domain-containing protein [Candidatus Solirubrobacter pratensis]